MSSPTTPVRRPGPAPRPGRRAGSVPAARVGVGPSGSGTAVRFGVDEALRLGALLHLVHVTPVPHAPRTVAVTSEQHPCLRTAAGRARALGAGAVDVSAEVRAGVDVAETLATGRRAGLLVVGRRRSGRVRRWVGGSTTDRVLCRADLPVVVGRHRRPWPPTSPVGPTTRPTREGPRSHSRPATNGPVASVPVGRPARSGRRCGSPSSSSTSSRTRSGGRSVSTR